MTQGQGCKVLESTYNSQRDNIGTPVVGPHSQCGYTALAMFLSSWIPEAGTDSYIYAMVDSLEPGFGRPGIGEQLVKMRPWMRGHRMGAFIENYISFAEMVLDKEEIGGQIIFQESDGTLDDMVRIIDQGSPAVYASLFTSDGHFVTLVGYYWDAAGELWFVFHDPYGDALTGYRGGRSGAYIAYPASFVAANTTRYGLRYFYVQDPQPPVYEMQPEVINFP
jgi:hypothetical protein